MKKYIPDRKIWAGGLTLVSSWMIMRWIFGVTDMEVVTTVSAILTLLAQYLIPPSAQDIIKRIDTDLRKKLAR